MEVAKFLECEKTCLALFMFHSHVTNFATCLSHFYLEVFYEGV